MRLVSFLLFKDRVIREIVKKKHGIFLDFMRFSHANMFFQSLEAAIVSLVQEDIPRRNRPGSYRSLFDLITLTR